MMAREIHCSRCGALKRENEWCKCATPKEMEAAERLIAGPHWHPRTTSEPAMLTPAADGIDVTGRMESGLH